MNQHIPDRGDPRQLTLGFRSQHTSVAAFESIPAGLQEATIYEWLQSRRQLGATLEEISFSTRIKLQSVCGRVHSLCGKELVKDSGRRRKTTSGRRAIVWIITHGGTDAADVVAARAQAPDHP